jgi:hypothetical protein
MDKEACGASGFKHGTVAGVLWQKGALGLAARPNTNSGPVRVGKESYFHLGIIASSKTPDVPRAAKQLQPLRLIAFSGILNQSISPERYPQNIVRCFSRQPVLAVPAYGP